MSDATPGPGAIVRAQRELRGLTQQDIADTLNLGARVVEDMETENWARLAGAGIHARLPARLCKTVGHRSGHGHERVRCGGESRRDARRSRSTSMQRSHRRGLADLSQKHPGVVLTGAVAGVICAVGIVLWAVWPDVRSEARPLPQQPAGPSEVALPKPAQAAATERGHRAADVATATPTATPASDAAAVAASVTVARSRCRTTIRARGGSRATATTASSSRSPTIAGWRSRTRRAAASTAT